MRHDLTSARKGARTDEDAAAIAWAQDEIERLQRAWTLVKCAVGGMLVGAFLLGLLIGPLLP
jgi:predicted GNAT superfamily acetyltransferase